MPIPGPGTAISMTTIATDFGGTVPHSLSEYYRGGGLVPNAPANAAIPTSGTISMGNFYGATNRISVPITIAANSFNYDVFANRGPAYVAGISDVVVTVNPGVTVGSTSTGTFAMLVPSGFNPGDTVTIVNNGVIQGMGGRGGNGGNSQPPNSTAGAPGSVGGNAISVSRTTVITNNGTVAGGGGGGGGASGIVVSSPKGSSNFGGPGGGGGAGFNGGAGGSGGIAPGPGALNGAVGGTGTSTTGGAGGVSQSPLRGGAGGGRGAAGSSGGANPPRPIGVGGAAGNYIVGNPFVTWPVTGTRQGGVA